MRNLVCPISSNKIIDTIPRIIAGQVITLLIIHFAFPGFLIPFILLIDFGIRSLGASKYSPLFIIARKLNENIKNKGVLINAAPKIFAARLGLVFSLFILLFQVLGFDMLSVIFTTTLLFCAALESFWNFCLGCFIYTFLIIPFYKTKHS